MLTTLLAEPTTASADPQWSARLLTGAGYDNESVVFDVGLRADLLFGAATDRAFRVGPQLELRTSAFDTLEAGLGLSLLLPVIEGWPLTVTAGGGYAIRGDDEAGQDLSGPAVYGILAFGFRSYNYHSSYGFALNLYVDARIDPTQTDIWEVSAGVEIDLEFLFVVPAMFLYTWIFDGGDPDETD